MTSYLPAVPLAALFAICVASLAAQAVRAALAKPVSLEVAAASIMGSIITGAALSVVLARIGGMS